jgi:hypothetical protein
MRVCGDCGKKISPNTKRRWDGLCRACWHARPWECPRCKCGGTRAARHPRIPLLCVECVKENLARKTQEFRDRPSDRLALACVVLRVASPITSRPRGPRGYEATRGDAMSNAGREWSRPDELWQGYLLPLLEPAPILRKRSLGVCTHGRTDRRGRRRGMLLSGDDLTARVAESDVKSTFLV